MSIPWDKARDHLQQKFAMGFQDGKFEPEPEKEVPAPPRRFKMVRSVDVSGVSGLGLVAYGVQFEDGNVCIRWCVSLRSTTVFASIEDLLAIHGHSGATNIEWID